MWRAASTRCDIAVYAATLISELHHPTLATALQTNKLVSCLYHTRTQPVVLQSDVSSGLLEFKVHSDAALEHEPLNGKSRGGFLIVIGPQGCEGQRSLQLPFRMVVTINSTIRFISYRKYIKQNDLINSALAGHLLSTSFYLSSSHHNADS